MASELIFIEGVSGVGKTTLIRLLYEELLEKGFSVKKYLEFDYQNPLDFYCTACLANETYNEIKNRYPQALPSIAKNSIPAGKYTLVRYYDDDKPLFQEPLLSELSRYELCYDPAYPIPLSEYTYVYSEVWRNYASVYNDEADYIIFDGSLLHHPINDMMRNYGADGIQALRHVKTLLDCLGKLKRRIFYLKTNDIRGQLTKARSDRNEQPPTEKDIAFWQKRFENDMTVLDEIRHTERCSLFDVSDCGQDEARKTILHCLTA